MTELQAVQSAIVRYASAYDELQRLQVGTKVIPTGDQKTGCIGEFYARLFLADRYPDGMIRFGGHSQSGWDIEVDGPDGIRRFQVKTVSAHSMTRRISRIAHGWDELLVVYLDTRLQPAGFWVITDKSIVEAGKFLRHCCSPQPGRPSGGSRAIPFGPDRIVELQKAVARALTKARKAPTRRMAPAPRLRS
jgi:hypothetical protein